MSEDWTPEKIAELRAKYANARRVLRERDFEAAEALVDDLADELPAALDEIERLRSRLELDAFTDGTGNPVSNADGRLDAYDGITCRDATIKLQDDEIERLRARVAELSGHIEAEKMFNSDQEAVLRDALQRRETLLREAVQELRASLSCAGRELAEEIAVELRDEIQAGTSPGKDEPQ